MRIAFLSDIHGNLPALQAVWEDLQGQRVEATYCLGDLSFAWTKTQVSADNKAWLRCLPLQVRLEDVVPSLLLVHGSPRKINEYLYEGRPRATFERVARLAGTDILVFGHTHLPYKKKVGRTLFVNVGSVGRPRDGDPRAGYVVFTMGRHPRAELRRVAYDVRAAAVAICESGLPAQFGEQLESGGEALRAPVAWGARGG